MPTPTLLNALGTQIIRAGKEVNEVELVASPQTNTVQQSVVRILCDVSNDRLIITLPSIKSFNGNWGIVTILFSDITGSAYKNNITINANDGDIIEGKPDYTIAANGESITLRVGSFIEGKGIWDRA